MQRPLVHIGYHKTGTTWFQESFYPHVRGGRYVPRKTVRAAFLAPGALQFDAAQARTLVGGAGRALLCEENLTGGLHNGGLAGCLSKDVAHRLHAALPEADIVIFTRDQETAIASAYLQYVKGGGTCSARRYLFAQERFSPVAPERDEAPRFRFDHFDYGPLIAHYDALFGRDRVHVYAYEDFRRDPRGFARHFARRHGLDVDIDALDFSARNPSLSRALLLGCRVANLFTRRAVSDKYCLVHIPGWYKASRVLMRRANASGWFGRPLRAADVLGEEERRLIAARYRAGNEALRRRIAYCAPECAAASRAASASAAASRRSTLPDQILPMSSLL